MAKKPVEPLSPGSGSSSVSTLLNTPSLAPSTFTDGQPLPKLIIFDLDYTLWPFWVDTHVTPPLKAKDNQTKAVDRLNETFAFYIPVPPILHACQQASIPIAIASRTHAPDLAISLLKLLHIPPISSFVTTSTLTIPSSSSSTLTQPTSSSSAGLSPPSPSDQNSSTSSLPLLSPSKAPSVPTRPSFSPSKSSKNLLSKAPPGSFSRRALDFFAYQAIYPGDKKSHMVKLQKASGVAFADMLFFDDENRNRNVENLGVTFWLVGDGVTKDEVDAGVRHWRGRKGRPMGSLSS